MHELVLSDIKVRDFVQDAFPHRNIGCIQLLVAPLTVNLRLVRLQLTDTFALTKFVL